MKKVLLGGNFYKANFHCHSTLSDGRLTPEQIKEAYTERGYSIVAYTDHDVLFCHNDLSDGNFLALNGYEIGMTEYGNGDDDFLTKKCIHICFIALDKNTDKAVCLTTDKWMGAVTKKYYSEHSEIIDTEMGFEREYTAESVNKVMKRGHDCGFFVTYNHPVWSMENYEQYKDYSLMDAFEIYNGGNIAAGYPDINESQYEDLLRLGNRIACVGGDDNHNVFPFDHPANSSFIGWTVVNATALTYEAVADAMREKRMYASMGPVIKELYVEDGVMHVECEPCRSIVFNTGIRVAKKVYKGEGDFVTGADFQINDKLGYVRVTLTDNHGYTAHTRAYWCDELK